MNQNKIDKYILFYCLELEPEKVILWHADRPTYFNNGVATDLSPGTFSPDTDWNHPNLVAKKLNFDELPTDIHYAYQAVLLKAREKAKNIDVVGFLKSQYTQEPFLTE